MTQKNGQQDVSHDKQPHRAHGTHTQPAQNVAAPNKAATKAETKAGTAKTVDQTNPLPVVANAPSEEKQITVDLTQPAGHNPITDTDWQAKGEALADATKAQLGSLRHGVEAGAQKVIQLAGQKSSEWVEFQDVREIQRWSALVGGGLLALFGLRRSLGSLTVMGVGLGFVYYALTGQSPLKQLSKSSGRFGQGSIGTSSLDSNRPMTVKNILVKAPLAEVYAAWADFENFPRFMQHIKSVSKTGERTSHWSMEGPLHTRLEWDAETTRLEENKRIAWSSTDGDLKTSGQVTFNALPDGHVEVTVMLRYVPPAGVAGDLFARLLDDPAGKLTTDLRNFKHYIENKR